MEKRPNSRTTSVSVRQSNVYFFLSIHEMFFTYGHVDYINVHERTMPRGTVSAMLLTCSIDLGWCVCMCACVRLVRPKSTADSKGCGRVGEDDQRRRPWGFSRLSDVREISGRRTPSGDSLTHPPYHTTPFYTTLSILLHSKIITFYTFNIYRISFHNFTTNYIKFSTMI